MLRTSVARLISKKLKRRFVEWLKEKLIRLVIDKLSACEQGEHVFRYQDAEPKMRDNNFKMVFRCARCGERFDVDSPGDVKKHGKLAEPWMYD